MNPLLFTVLTLVALTSFASTCNVTGNYRCKNGREGSVSGRGSNIESAKVIARDRAREICSGMVDYVRFDPTSGC